MRTLPLSDASLSGRHLDESSRCLPLRMHPEWTSLIRVSRMYILVEVSGSYITSSKDVCAHEHIYFAE